MLGNVVEVNLRLSIVIRRPCTLILSLATCTKRLRWWKKSARSKNVPPNLKVSGTWSSAGTLDAGVAVEAAPLAPVAPVAPAELLAAADWAAEPDSAALAARAFCTAAPKAVAALAPPLGSVEVTAAAVARWPTWIEPNWMPVPLAAELSWTSRLGMSTLVGRAFPRRTISAYWLAYLTL